MATMEDVDILSAGAAPLIAAYCREIGIADIVNDMVRWDRDQWSVTPGDLLVTLIVNLLVDRAPLYRVRDFYENRDLDLLFGPGRVPLSALNDRHFGTLLDRLFDANPKLVYEAISTSAIVSHHIDLRQLHSDTTSQSVYGQYDRDGELQITYGHSKDYRPDLK
ncbi:DUF4277 domain-containing protein [Heliobacillus mobilis]|uniref:DUF4277 domain-containing protein n=1 Tax=Heliobacterium mobile TaxID=28064 RepID=A0A6I3SPT8_HELMO|nr:DUF4277 domain-containing protein [Heliobacterium mobile]MTV50909.1 DUF4277 domain-containing protein [Heliobacterium mobile]